MSRILHLAAAVFAASLAALVYAIPGGAQTTSQEAVSSDPPPPHWTCRASAGYLFTEDPKSSSKTRVEPAAANAGEDECASADAGATPRKIGGEKGQPGYVTLHGPFARTRSCQWPQGPFQPSDPDPPFCGALHTLFERPSAEAGTAGVEICRFKAQPDDPNTPQDESRVCDFKITADLAYAEARAKCTDALDPDAQLESSSYLTNVRIDPDGDGPATGVVVGDLAPTTPILLEPLGTIFFNEKVRTAEADGETLTQRAIRVHLHHPQDKHEDGRHAERYADLVVAESTVDYHGDVCPPTKVTVDKVAETADPNDQSRAFRFTSTHSPEFWLTDAAAPKEILVRPDPQQPQTVTVTEDAPAGGWALRDIACRDASGDTTTDLGKRTANARLGPGETVDCTFVNIKPFQTAGQTTTSTTFVCPDGTTAPSVDACPPFATLQVLGTRDTGGDQPIGGTLVRKDDLVRRFPHLRGHPCLNPRYGGDFAVIGTNGRDRITGSKRSDAIFGFGGKDDLSGGNGEDCIDGGTGLDKIGGDNQSDLLFGRSGSDNINGGNGNDRIRGGIGNDKIAGGSGSDRMFGDAGRDRVSGGLGNDRAIGGSGRDYINTGNGRDRVSGGAGNDSINASTAGPGAVVNCGAGLDTVRGNNNDRARNCERILVTTRSGRLRRLERG